MGGVGGEVFEREEDGSVFVGASLGGWREQQPGARFTYEGVVGSNSF